MSDKNSLSNDSNNIDINSKNNKVKNPDTMMDIYEEYYNTKTKDINLFRRIYFYGISSIFLIVIIISFILIIYSSIKNLLIVVVPSSVTFLSALILFPLIITKYLFNNEEDISFYNLYKEYAIDVHKTDLAKTQLKIKDQESNIDVTETINQHEKDIECETLGVEKSTEKMKELDEQFITD